MRLLLQLCFRHGPPPSAQDHTSFAGRPLTKLAVNQDLWLSYTGSCFSWDSPFATFFLFDGWFKMASLRYSSHSIEFNHFNCTLHIFLYIHQVVQPSPQATSEHFHYAEQKPCALSDHSIVSCVSSGPRQPLIHFLSLQTCLFCSCHLNRIMCGFFFLVCVCV